MLNIVRGTKIKLRGFAKSKTLKCKFENLNQLLNNPQIKIC